MKCRYTDKCKHDAYYCTDSTMFKCLEGLQFLVAEQASDNAALQERCNELTKELEKYQSVDPRLCLRTEFEKLDEIHTYAEKVGSL